ncbi:MAG: response regulator transcription factor [Acidimicrobiia bacterium]|nr:response regulator transcription factor [Acidimicrobiia bacterium]
MVQQIASGADTAKILVVEDAPEFQEILSAALEADGYRVAVVDTGEEALEHVRHFQPDVVLLDLVLPGLDGTEVCRQLRTFTDAYIVMVTGKDAEVDKLIGLAVGADDYLTKPFSPRELVARVNVLLRRPRLGAVQEESPVLSIGDLEVDTQAREVSAGGQPVELTRIEFDLLATLSSNPNMVYSRQLLLETVWGDTWFDDHVVDVHIGNLRKKIDTNGVRHIKTVRGVGYRIAPAS